RDYPVSYVRWTEHRNMVHFLRLLETGAVRVEPLITHRFCLEEAPAAYRTILDPASGSLAVLLRYPETERPASVPHVRPRRTVEVSAPRAHQGNELRLAVAAPGNVARWAPLPAPRAIPEVTLRAVFAANGARGRSDTRRCGRAYCSSDHAELCR